jgi:hypothetical protein
MEIISTSEMDDETVLFNEGRRVSEDVVLKGSRFALLSRNCV